MAKPEEYIPPFFLDPKDELTPEEEDKLHKFMIRLGDVIKKHRILLKPHFQDKVFISKSFLNKFIRTKQEVEKLASQGLGLYWTSINFL